MSKQQIIWTTLPNGVKREGARTILKLSIFASPRLRFEGTQTTGTLAEFAHFLDWPSHLQAGRLTISLVIDNDVAHAVPATIVTDPPPDSALWRTLFTPAMKVTAHAFQVQRDPISSYAADKIVAGLYRGYGEVGQTSPYRLPDAATLKRAFPDAYEAIAPASTSATLPHLADLEGLSAAELSVAHRALGDNLLRHDPETSFDARLTGALAIAGRLARESGADGAIDLVPDTGTPASALARFVAFHRRASRPRGGNSAPSREPVADASQPEFHETVSALGEYPDLLRRLGFVIDLEIAADRLPESLFGHARSLGVEIAFSESELTNCAYTPNTRYLLDLRQTGSTLPFPIFSAAPRRATEAGQPSALAHDLEIVGGLLNLGMPRVDDPTKPQYDLVQVDVDGAMLKVLNAVEAVVLEEQRPAGPIDRAAEAAAPAFRSSGISIVRSGHASALAAGTRRAEAHERALQRNETAEFFAEDLIRGYRIDVRRFPTTTLSDTEASASPWLSLHQRNGTVTFGAADATPLTLAIADEGFVQPAFVQDLDASAPGSRAVAPIHVPESMCHWKNWSLSAPSPATPVEVAPPVHPIDTAAVPDVNIDFQPAPNSLPRLRFGDAYQLRARTVDLAGNGPCLTEADAIVDALAAQGRRLPILSARPGDFRYGRFEPINAPEVVPRDVLTEGEAHDVLVIRGDGSACERHIVPPKAALEMIETHGLLDGALGRGGNPARHYNLCRRESGSLDDPFITNLQTGTPDYLPDQVAVDPDTGAPITVPHGVRFVRLQGPGGADGYTVHHEPQLRLPYLPDPLARAASLFGLPGVRNTTGQLDANGELTWSSPSGQVLARPATKDLGFLTKVKFGSSNTWPDLLPFRLRLDTLPADAPSAKPQWSRTTRTLTVRLPPGETATIWISSCPAPDDVDLLGLHGWWRRQLGPPTDEQHFLNMAAHGALAMISPPRKLTLVHAVQRPVTPPVQSTDSPLRPIKFPRDTAAYIAGAFNVHVASTQKLDLLASWEERGDGPGGADLRQVHTHVFEVPIPPNGPAPSVQPLAIFDGTQRIEFRSPPEGTAAPTERYLAKHEFGDTKYRRVTYRLVATSRFREYFPERIASDADNLTRTFEKRNVIIRSSAAPAAPEVTHIVPVFGWTTDGAPPRVNRSVRRGGALRVYLGTTWHSSGEGEQLAVIEAPGANRWGLDPLHVTPATTVASPIKPDVRAAGAPGSPYDGQVYPYDVHFDRDLGLWYSDITFRVGDAYFPFKELALARYQKNSLNGLHVSPVVHAGMHQLAPDRTATLAYLDAGPANPGRRKVTIAVSALALSAFTAGTAASAVAGVVRRSVVEVTLEERDIARQHWDADLGWTPATAAQQPVAEGTPSLSQLWTGHVLVPSSPGATQRRLVIREFEVFPVNDCPPGQAWIGDAHSAARRLVYADTIRLD